jgi:lipoprotein-anchoring transpeptidase ErfK/SrfK
MRRALVLICVPLVMGALVACGSTSSRSSSTRTSVPGGDTRSRAAQPAWHAIEGLAATARGPLAVYSSRGSATPASTLPAVTPFGSPMTVRVLSAHRDGAWLRVALPTRPNGSTGYVRVSDVDLARVSHRLDIDLGARRLRVGDATGAVVIDTAIAIGAPANPTPVGDFYVTDVIDTGNPEGAYGQFAVGVAAHSVELPEFAGGDGAIGVHGTNQPASIGQAVSHGCVRVPNDVAARLAAMLALGTPVKTH